MSCNHVNIREWELNTPNTPYYFHFLEDVIIFKDVKNSGVFFFVNHLLLF